MGSHGEVETIVDTARGTRACTDLCCWGRGGGSQGGRVDSKEDPTGMCACSKAPQRSSGSEGLGQGHQIDSEVTRDLGDQVLESSGRKMTEHEGC